ncbi:MAG: hypothetical protein L6405_03255 [Actinomycetia bacterium]|nr:hypothetical protein [Actinomycetes bacterium]
MPTKLIDFRDLNNWNQYSKNLNKLSFMKKYLGDTLKIWVKNIINPLSITLIANLYENDLNSFNDNLGRMEKSIGENNLSELFHELKIQKNDPAQITTKIHSLYGEIFAFSELIKKYNKVVKIKEFGDWLCDDNTVISVKTKNELDHNYELIENALRALYFIKENNVLRKYNNIEIGDGKNIDDKFRNNVLWFINSVLVEFINFQDKQLNTWNSFKLETIKYFFDNSKLQNILETEVEFFKDNDNKFALSITLKEDRSGEKEKFSHQVKLIFNDWPDKNTLCVSYDTNAYWIGDKIEWQSLKNSVYYYLKKFDKSHNILKEQNKNLIGWINILLHPKHEVYISKSADLKKEIKDMVDKKEYKIVIALRPIWNSIKPEILEI